ncbi:hypothetical protein EEL37_14695 [Muribaculaceae bacterium Isolate-077 (Janvier)]|nr:hypothetical protein EEL37_14695 [Muribaculaceae bacterium Isolate-077 (Janvier)]
MEPAAIKYVVSDFRVWIFYLIIAKVKIHLHPILNFRMQKDEQWKKNVRIPIKSCVEQKNGEIYL